MSYQRPTNPVGLLRHYRPTRYEHQDREWMRPAIDARIKELRQRHQDDPQVLEHIWEEIAERDVRRWEEGDCRAAHLFLREVGRTGQWPLTMEFEERVKISPIRIVLGVSYSGRDLKVRFQLCQTADFEAWELGRGRIQDHASEIAIWERRGARTLSRWMLAQGVDLAGNLDKGAVDGSIDGPGADDDPEDDD